MHNQPPKSPPRFHRDVPLIRGTFETSLKRVNGERLLISIIHHISESFGAYRWSRSASAQNCVMLSYIQPEVFDILPHPKGWGFLSVPDRAWNCAINKVSHPKMDLQLLLQGLMPQPCKCLSQRFYHGHGQCHNYHTAMFYLASSTLH